MVQNLLTNLNSSEIMALDEFMWTISKPGNIQKHGEAN